MITHLCPRLAGLAWATSLLLLLSPGACRADLLPVDFVPDRPVILGINGNLTYSAASDNFHSETPLLALSGPTLPGGFALFSSGQTVIDLFVAADGSFAGSGTGVRVTGAIDLDGDGTVDVSGLLLFGAVTAFGADDPGSPTRAFNGLYAIEGGLFTQPIALSGGGSLPALFDPGGQGLFFLFAENVTSGTLANFQADFASSSVKDNLGVPIPEPASWFLMLTGGGVFAGRRLRKRVVPTG